MLARGWGAGPWTFAGRAKRGNVQIDFHCRINRTVHVDAFGRFGSKDTLTAFVTRDN